MSDRAIAIIAHPAGSKGRTEAIKAAADAPSIFQELDAKFADGRGNDEGMRAYLLNKFIPGAAEMTIRAYRETKKVAAAESGGYDSASIATAADDGELDSSGGASNPPPPHNSPLRDPQLLKKGAVLIEGERELTTGLLAKDASFRLIVNGPVGVREIERLIRKLELDKEILADENEETKSEE